MPIPEKANSLMLLRPMTTAPAARSRATATASAVAGGASRRIFEPAVVTSPAMSKRSLIETGSRSEEHTSELQSQSNLVCRLLLEKKKRAAERVRQADHSLSCAP